MPNAECQNEYEDAIKPSFGNKEDGSFLNVKGMLPFSWVNVWSLKDSLLFYVTNDFHMDNLLTINEFLDIKCDQDIIIMIKYSAREEFSLTIHHVP